MVTKIREPKNFRNAIYYNEHKVEQGKAECIAAENFLKSVTNLSIREKMHRLKSLIELGEGVTYNTLHISVSFHPSERFSKEKMAEIGRVYMEKIGFGEQPFLIYQHHDTAHAHMHIVTTTIREDGNPIDINNIGRNQSEQARKEIEIAYNLVKAQDQKRALQEEIRALDVQRLQYGKSETKRGIANVIDTILAKYKCSSLEELNAVLSLYNVRAFRGSPDSRLYKMGGLLYQLLDEQGHPVGVPVKASSIYSKPTLNYLNQEFQKHLEKSSEHKKRVQHAIDLAIRAKPHTLDDFAKYLKNEQVYVVARKNKDGFVYGLTFVDTKNKVVFNGSDIGMSYSAQHILARINLDQKLNPLPPGTKIVLPPAGRRSDQAPDTQLPLPFPAQHTHYTSPSSLSDDDPYIIPLRPPRDDEQTPVELLVDKKRKRNQKPNN